MFSSLTSTTSSTDLARLFRELDEAKKKIKQWEEAWHQVKQVSVIKVIAIHVTLYLNQRCNDFLKPRLGVHFDF